MSIGTYTELQDAVLKWTHREGDSAFTAMLPDFIRLAEVRFNRALRMRAQETALASTALTNGAVSLPAGFLAFKELRYDNASGWALEPRPFQWVKDRNQTGSSASEAPIYYAVTGAQILCSGQAGSIVGTYYAEIPPLASNSTNWLLTASPDLYLFAALTETALYMQADDRIPLWADRAAKLLEAVQSQDNANAINGGPLQVRVR